MLPPRPLVYATTVQGIMVLLLRAYLDAPARPPAGIMVLLLRAYLDAPARPPAGITVLLLRINLGIEVLFFRAYLDGAGAAACCKWPHQQTRRPRPQHWLPVQVKQVL
jgi:hypothetical protein